MLGPDETDPSTRPRRLLERMCIIDVGDDAVLEGLMQSGEGLAVLIVPHVGGGPLCMSGPVCAEIVWRLAAQNAHTLRFDYRGFGASSGTRSMRPDTDDVSNDAFADLLADARAAYEVLRETCARPVSVIGVGLGAQVAARLCGQVHVRAFCAVAPDARLTLDGAPIVNRCSLIDEHGAPGYAHIPLPDANFGAGEGLTVLATRVLEALSAPA